MSLQFGTGKTGMVDCPEREASFAASNGSAALGEKKWNVICTLLEAAKPSYESGDEEQHRAYCQAIGILIRRWQP